MTTITGPASAYHLADRRTGGAAFGLAVGQLLLVASGVVALVLLPVLLHSMTSVIAGMVVAVTAGILAFCPAAGRPAYLVVPVAARFAARRISGRARWCAPLPL